eukprot:gene12727-3449_t
MQMLNQKHDDLELQNVAPLPAPKPIEMEGGLANTAFGDIAMLVEFVYVFNKFLAPEETPSITAEQLIKALAAGGQGADVISKILLVFLRALIGEEEREINGLGIGLADMPLTVFTVSELLYHYLRLTCSKPAKGNKANDSKDGDEEDEEEDDDASSVASTNHGFVDEEEMPRRIINWLEKNEFFTLSASDKLKVLVFLFHKIIDSEYYSDYSENLRMETRELWRQQDAFRKKAAKERKEEQSKNAENKSPAVCSGWQRLAAAGSGWQWLAVAGSGWQWLAVAGSGWQWLALAGSGWQWLAVAGSGWQWLAVAGSGWQWLAVAGSGWQ